MIPAGAEVIWVCGIHFACRGNEATGTMEFDFEGSKIELPVCFDCVSALEAAADRLDNSTGYEVE